MSKATLSSLKCPTCGGPPNRYNPIGYQKGKIILLVECWSGNLDTAESKPRHLFVVKLRVPVRTRRMLPLVEVKNENE